MEAAIFPISLQTEAQQGKRHHSLHGGSTASPLLSVSVNSWMIRFVVSTGLSDWSWSACAARCHASLSKIFVLDCDGPSCSLEDNEKCVLAIVVGTASRVVQFTASHAIVALLGGFGFDWALGFGCGTGLAFLVGD